MNLFVLSWRYTWSKQLSAVLNVLMLALGLGALAFILLAQQRLTAVLKGGAGLGEALPVGRVVLEQHPDGIQRARHRRVVGRAQQIF